MESRPIRWNVTTDLICVGSGIAGLSAAITAREFGAESLILERSTEVGGVTAYSFGEVWIAGNHLAEKLGLADTAQAGFEYIKQLGMGFAEDALNRNQAEHAPAVLRFFEDKIGLCMAVIRNFADYYWPECEHGLAEGRFLEPLPFPAPTLGDWQSRTKVSPHVPYGMTHADMFEHGGVANFLNWDFSVMAKRLERDDRCLGPGLAAYFVKGAIDREIPFFTGTSVERLIFENGRVVGVAAKRNGEDFFIGARRGVLLATSGIDGNDLMERQLGQRLAVQPMVMRSVDGSHVRLAGRLGAKVAGIPDASMLGYSIPGEEQDGRPLWRNALTDMGLPHSIVVNRRGRRFGDESFYRSLSFAVDQINGWNQTHPNYPCWIIQDSQARAKYIFGSIMPGAEMPEGFAIKANSLSELANQAGIDGEGLTAEVNRFNAYCANGADPDFHRGERAWGRFMCGDTTNKPNPNLASISKAPFYAVPLSRISSGGIASVGLVADTHARVLDYDDRPIENLYVAGNASARLDSGAVLQSGYANARGMVQGHLAGRHAARSDKASASQETHDFA